MPSVVHSAEIEPIYRALFAYTNDAIVVFSTDGLVLEASAQASKLLGYSLDELRTMTAAALIEPAHLEEQRRLRLELQQRDSLSFERMGRRPDGSAYPIEVRLSKILDDDGLPTAIIAIVRDISDRKAAELAEAQAERLRIEHQRVDLLKQIATAAMVETPLNELFRQTVAAIHEIVPQYRVSFSLVEGNTLTVQYSMPPPTLPSTEGLRAQVSDLWNSITSHGRFEPLIIENMAGAPRIRTVLEQQLPSVSQALLGVPLRYDDTLTGIVALNSGEPHVWLEYEIDLLRECAASLTMAIAATLEREQRQKSDARLRESEWRYRTLINNFPNVSVSLYDHDLRVLVAGGGAMGAVDMTIEDVEGKTVRDIFPPPMVDLVEPLMRQALAGTRLKREMSFMGFTFDAHYLPIFDAQGNIIAGMTVSTDITEQTRAVEALAEKHHLLQTIIDSVPGHIFVKDRDSRFIAVNASVYNTLGLSPGELVGLTDFDVYPHDMASAFVADDKMVISSGEPLIDREEFDQDKEGHLRTILTSKVPFRDRQGDIIGIIGQAHNITERKLWEIELQRERDFTATILNITSALIFVLDDKGRFVSFNRACERLSGYSADEVIGRTPEFLLFPEHAPAVLSLIDSILAGEPMDNYVTPWRQRDGQARTILLSSRAFTSNEGATYLLASGTDISDREELEQSNLDLALEREKIRFLHEFVCDVSHDLQTPLSVLNSNMSMMRRTTDPERAEKRITVMEQQVTRLMKLIDQLLTMSRLDSPNEVDHEHVDLAEVARTVTMTFRKAARERQLKLEDKIDPTPLTVTGDHEHLSLALSNLLENALRYASTTATIRAFREGDEIAIEIGDDGSGIEAADLPFIFERFYRGDKARSTETGGTGLGLSIARKIAEVHGGRIEVESVIGEGSRFRFLLPSP